MVEARACTTGSVKRKSGAPDGVFGVVGVALAADGDADDGEPAELQPQLHITLYIYL